MNPYLQEYITLTREYHAQDGKPSSVAALYDLADELAKSDDLDAKKVLADLYPDIWDYLEEEDEIKDDIRISFENMKKFYKQILSLEGNVLVTIC